MAVLYEVPYKVNSAIGAEDTEAALDWLRALGVETLVVNGPASTDEYKDIKSPARFEGVLPLVQRENGDDIYAVLPPGASLAHVLREGELVPVRASGQFEYSDIRKYAQAAGDAARPAATFEWTRGARARIRANLHAGDLLSVQVAWFPGWKASVRGQPAPVSADGMGFLVIRPQCQGDCEIDLAWTGRGDYAIAGTVSAAALALIAVMIFRRRRSA